MYRIYVGIVLVPGEYKTIVFDRDRGKQALLFTGARHQLCRGMLFYYTMDRNRASCVDLLDIPVHTDVLFVHQVIEVIEHCMPYHLAHENLFNELLLLYTIHEKDDWMKQIILARIFFLIGMYPDMDVMSHSSFEQIIKTSLSVIQSENFDIDFKENVGLWVRACIVQHKQHTTFKTL